jgi:hypothetical protein
LGIGERDRDEIDAAWIHDPVDLYCIAEIAVGGHIEAVVGDLADAETEQRLGMLTRERSQVLQHISCRIAPGQDEVSLISLKPDELVFARLGREITFNNLTIDTPISRDHASKARSNKEAAETLHDSTCGTTETQTPGASSALKRLQTISVILSYTERIT